MGRPWGHCPIIPQNCSRGRGAAGLTPRLAQVSPQVRHAPAALAPPLALPPSHHHLPSLCDSWCFPAPAARRCPFRQCPAVPVPRCPQTVPVPRCPQAVPSCSVQMLVAGQATVLSVRRALRAQQRRQEARLPCEHTAPSFMAKNSPPGCGPAWKSPLQPRPAHVYSARGGGGRAALPPPAGPAHHLPARAAALGRGSPGPPRPKHTGWGGGGWQTPKKRWVCLREKQPPVMS